MTDIITHTLPTSFIFFLAVGIFVLVRSYKIRSTLLLLVPLIAMVQVFFLDFGNVFSTDCQDYQINCFEPSVDELRYSIGVGVTWITGFGPMSFSFSQPFNDGIYDRTEEFQFTIGTVF